MLITRSVATGNLLLGFTLWVRCLHADPIESLEIQYNVDPGCPDLSRFQQEFLGRLSRPVRLDLRPASGQLRVRIRLDATGANAELSLTDLGGETSARQFRTATCQDAIQAVALVAALAVDPHASLLPAPAAPADGAPESTPAANSAASQSSTEPSASASPTQPAPTGTAKIQEKRERKPAFHAPPVGAPSPISGSDSSRGSAVRREKGPFSFGPGLLLALGPAPPLLFGATFGAGVELPGPRPWSPWVGVSAMAARTGIVSPQDSRATFTFLTSELEGCPVRFDLTSKLTFRPCLSLELGEVAATGEQGAIPEPRTAARIWLASGLSSRLSVQTGHWELFFSLGVLGVITKYSFVFQEPRALVYDLPRVVWISQLGAWFRP